MHTLLNVTTLALVFFGSYLAINLLQRQSSLSQRRILQLSVLAAPVLSLAVAFGELYHFLGRPCLLDVPAWDYTLGIALPVGIIIVALGGLALAAIRQAVMVRVMARSGTPANPDLQALAESLAQRLGAPQPLLLICAYQQPLALTYGVQHPIVLLSTWMVEHLDRRELESVLAHELGHITRRDYLAIWLSTILRDAFFYLPTSQMVYRQLQHEKELICDDLAVQATNRPLALASALAKVWQHSVDYSPVGAAQSILGVGESIETRIQRLLATPQPVALSPSPSHMPLSLSVLMFAGLLVLEAINVIVVLTMMGCGPTMLLRMG